MIVFQIQALDKIRFLSLTDKDILGEGDNTKLEIQVSNLCPYYVFRVSIVYEWGTIVS